MASDISPDRREYDIFLIGKTGTGKSATGNSILRRDAKTKKKYFTSASSAQSVTFDVHREWAVVDGQYVKVVDGPGLAENRVDPKAAEKKAREDMCQAMGMCGGGFHALALVLKFGDRFTKETKACLKLLRSFFGEDFLMNYGIIILTNGDNFQSSMEDEDTPNRTFKEWCKSQRGEMLDLFEHCNFRVVLFNNRTRANDELKEQRRQLFDTIDSLKGERYTNAVFKQIKRARKQKVEETKDLQFKEEVMKTSSIIVQKLEDIVSEFSEEKGNYKDIIFELDQVEKQTQDLLHEISTSDRTSARVKELRDEANRILELVRSHREQVQKCQDAATGRREAEIQRETKKLKQKFEEELRCQETETRQHQEEIQRERERLKQRLEEERRCQDAESRRQRAEMQREKERLKEQLEEERRCQDADTRRQRAELQREKKQLKYRLEEEKKEMESLKASASQLEDMVKKFDNARRQDIQQEESTFTEWLGNVAWEGVKGVGNFMGSWMGLW